MNNPAIVLHKPETVLQLGPVGLKASAGWTQEDSDTLAHFIQVRSQISRSSWRKQKVTFDSCSGETSGTFPDFESFVYVAVYFRQLFSDKDHLFEDACDRYIRAVDSPVKSAWMHQEKEAALSHWTSPGWMVPTHTTTTPRRSPMSTPDVVRIGKPNYGSGPKNSH